MKPGLTDIAGAIQIGWSGQRAIVDTELMLHLPVEQRPEVTLSDWRLTIDRTRFIHPEILSARRRPPGDGTTVARKASQSIRTVPVVYGFQAIPGSMMDARSEGGMLTVQSS